MHQRDQLGITLRLIFLVHISIIPSDNLRGTSVYGTYEPSLTSAHFFSVPFTANASAPILFTSGDRSLYLVARYANVTSRTTGAGLSFLALMTSESGLWFFKASVFYQKARQQVSTEDLRIRQIR
jgi:hypothetical protein